MNETRVIVKQCSTGILTSMAVIFLQDAVRTMLPWLFTVLAVILCDLAFGVRKSLELDIHTSSSRAIRTIMSKMVTYVAWIVAAAMIGYAKGHSLNIATWARLLVYLIEGMDIIGNMLKPYGYDLSVKSYVVFFLSLVFRQDKEKLEDLISDEHLDMITAGERRKWRGVKKKNSTGLSG